MIRSRSSPKPDQQTIVVKSAVASRLLLLSLILLWRTLLSPYDTSASLNPNCLNQHPSPPHAHAHPNPQQQPPLWPTLASAIESSVVWDGVYFVRIAQCGYEYEQSYAFLPLLPLCISMLSRTGMPQLHHTHLGNFVNLFRSRTPHLFFWEIHSCICFRSLCLVELNWFHCAL